MKFHALLPVRDEADIIGQSLAALLRWADAIYVFDTGSVDETWAIVQDLAHGDERIKPLRKEPVFFSETRLRGWIFHQARRNMREGDWFVRVDADEFHHIEPPAFVSSHMKPFETIAYHQYYDFRLLESEVADWEAGRETIADRRRPIEERRRWYIPCIYSEPRLCRYRESMRWPSSVSFPFNAGYVARERLPIRHYPHRDPAQMERRCRLRAIMMADQENRSNWTKPELHHWAEREWRKFVVKDDAPGLSCWAPGTDLPMVQYTDHIRRQPTRAVQRLIHAAALPILDRLRPRRDENEYPQRMPAPVIAALDERLREK